eukprot:CAMPEP_0181212454 /NCGR_PEP_ID=MMETSP1096-20121128/24356_1 /TAXON_ID=156174 ORGANISM="Chrysochromulina ericina, Strain CCMP281" /NCGR_SAMPLE_ID=MMETSP1096 /ASSEMBLY_ACC=CAM_ASM_000453 /LENGTH=138 /DNA_ID=CAMNT_0023303979 /DNA_START=114 /DNA_END=530 /DNA_ORIENTATION=+
MARDDRCWKLDRYDLAMGARAWACVSGGGLQPKTRADAPRRRPISHLRDHRRGVPQLLQDGPISDLLLGSRSAEVGVHRREAAHEDQRVCRRGVRILADLRLVNPSRFGLVRRRRDPAGGWRLVWTIANDVDDSKPAS